MCGLGKAHPEGMVTHLETKPACLGTPYLAQAHLHGDGGGAGEPRCCHQWRDVVVGSAKEGTAVLEVLLPH